MLKDEVEYLGRRELEKRLRELLASYNITNAAGIHMVSLIDTVRALGKDKSKELVDKINDVWNNHRKMVIEELLKLAQEVNSKPK